MDYVSTLEAYGYESAYDEDLRIMSEKRFAEGMEQGREEGIILGIEKGREEGEKAAILKSAQNMLSKGLSRDLISEILGLSEEEIQAISSR